MARSSDYVVFSADSSYPSLPYFQLIIANNNTELAIYLPYRGVLPSARTPLVPGRATQVGVRYWYADFAHRWEYIIDGIVEAGTGPVWIASPRDLNLNVVSAMSDMANAPAITRWDEIMFWRPNNGITDEDLRYEVSELNELYAMSADLSTHPAMEAGLVIVPQWSGTLSVVPEFLGTLSVQQVE